MRMSERLGPLIAFGRNARPRTAAVVVGELGALIALVGSLLPWGTGGTADCYTRDHGLAMLPLVVAAAGLLAVPYLKGAEGVPFRLAALGAVLCGVAVATFVSYDIVDVSHIPTNCIVDFPVEDIRGSPALGAYLTQAGSILLGLGALAAAASRPRAAGL